MNIPPTTTGSLQSATLPVGNPFTPGGVITSHDKFFGREKVLSAITARLRGMLSVSVVGEARMGKSSLLKILEADVAQWRTYLPIYLSMDSHRTQTSFCQALLRRVVPHMRPPSDNQQANEATLRGFERQIAQEHAFTFEETINVLELAHAWGLHVVLLLDEFKDLLEKPKEFDDTFRGQLRSLYTHSKIALVLATRQPITHIPELNAYFANGITMHELNLFSPEAAKALLEQPHDHPFSEKEVNLGLNVAKHHPLRLQLVGFQLYFWKTQVNNPLYHAPTHLHTNAFNILHAPVQEQFDHMMLSSKEYDGRTYNASRWIGRILLFCNPILMQIDRILTLAEAYTGKLSAILLVFLLLITILAACGLMNPELVQSLLNSMQDNS